MVGGFFPHPKVSFLLAFHSSLVPRAHSSERAPATMRKSDAAIVAHTAAHAVVTAMPDAVKSRVFSEDGWSEEKLLAALLSPTHGTVEAVLTQHHLGLFWIDADTNDKKRLLEVAMFACDHTLQLQLTEDMEEFIGMEPGSLACGGLTYVMAEAAAKENAAFEPLPAEGESYDKFMESVTAVMAGRVAKWKRSLRKNGVTGGKAKARVEARASIDMVGILTEAAIDADISGAEYASWVSAAKQHAMAPFA